MGYFSNGAEGLDYAAKWCKHCWHNLHNNCPVWALHLSTNYDPTMTPVRNSFIPYKDGENQTCVMFLDIGK